MNSNFWRDRSVFLTGHTGFKGGWTALCLSHLGAKVYGYALDPVTTPNFFTEADIASRVHRSTIGDIRDLDGLTTALRASKPSVVIHMAAQALVRESYVAPVDTFATNVLGTVNLLEAVRQTDGVASVINITTDKVYKNEEWVWPYREHDRLGGHDPYSSSKACAELVADAYRKSFFSGAGVGLASVRAGNIIAGGDWSVDRLVPDFFRALDAHQPLRVRSPLAVRPWQHVLEPVSGYLLLAEKLVTMGQEFAEAWNFGPEETDAKSVAWIAEQLCSKAPGANWEALSDSGPHEAGTLKLDSSKARERLSWCPRWCLDSALSKTLDWHLAWRGGEKKMDEFSLRQIEEYLGA